MVRLKDTSLADISILKRRGWEMQAIEHLFADNEVIEVRVIFVSKKIKDLSVTINAKSKTLSSSKVISFDDMALFSKIALEGGFEVDE